MAAIESPFKERITPERFLDLRGVLDDLMRSKIVTQRDAEDILIAPRTAKQMHMHPLEIIAERELDDPRRPGEAREFRVRECVERRVRAQERGDLVHRPSRRRPRRSPQVCASAASISARCSGSGSAGLSRWTAK